MALEPGKITPRFARLSCSCEPSEWASEIGLHPELRSSPGAPERGGLKSIQLLQIFPNFLFKGASDC